MAPALCLVESGSIGHCATARRPRAEADLSDYRHCKPQMKFDDLYITGCGTWLPEPMTVDAAERAGLCDRRLIWRTEIVSACVAGEESAPEMAALAAVPALRQAGCDPADIDLVLHAATYYQGHDLWPPASYVQRV